MSIDRSRSGEAHRIVERAADLVDPQNAVRRRARAQDDVHLFFTVTIQIDSHDRAVVVDQIVPCGREWTALVDEVRTRTTLCAWPADLFVHRAVAVVVGFVAYLGAGSSGGKRSPVPVGPNEAFVDAGCHSKFVRGEQVTRVREQLKNYTKLRRLVDRWIEAGAELSNLRIEEEKG